MQCCKQIRLGWLLARLFMAAVPAITLLTLVAPRPGRAAMGNRDRSSATFLGSADTLGDHLARRPPAIDLLQGLLRRHRFLLANGLTSRVRGCKRRRWGCWRRRLGGVYCAPPFSWCVGLDRVVFNQISGVWRCGFDRGPVSARRRHNDTRLVRHWLGCSFLWDLRPVLPQEAVAEVLVLLCRVLAPWQDFISTRRGPASPPWSTGPRRGLGSYGPTLNPRPTTVVPFGSSSGRRGGVDGSLLGIEEFCPHTPLFAVRITAVPADFLGLGLPSIAPMGTSIVFFAQAVHVPAVGPLVLIQIDRWGGPRLISPPVPWVVARRLSHMCARLPRRR
mmetsp:Transcript_824/g.2646  ORF Transcript_824/g.2646 Transcript_824/m.2646 type:complete len:333 (+) Transcript_824:843-1841(+)